MSTQTDDAGRTGPILQNLECTCASCGTERLVIQNVAIRGTSEGERFDEVVPHLRARGWGMRRVPHPAGETCPTCGSVRTVRQVLCPGCLRAHLMHVTFTAARLHPHDIKSKCPKCGAGEARVVYCDGRGDSDFVPVEHLRRTCKRCGYAWPERCVTPGETPCSPASGTTNSPPRSPQTSAKHPVA